MPIYSYKIISQSWKLNEYTSKFMKKRYLNYIYQLLLQVNQTQVIQIFVINNVKVLKEKQSYDSH